MKFTRPYSKYIGKGIKAEHHHGIILGIIVRNQYKSVDYLKVVFLDHFEGITRSVPGADAFSNIKGRGEENKNFFSYKPTHKERQETVKYIFERTEIIKTWLRS